MLQSKSLTNVFMYREYRLPNLGERENGFLKDGFIQLIIIILLCSNLGAVRAGGYTDWSGVERLGRRHRSPTGRLATALPTGTRLWGCRGKILYFDLTE